MRNKYSSWLGIGLLFTLVTFTFLARSYADQGFYVLDKAARPGMLVSLTNNPGVVEPATSDNATKLVGVLRDNPTIITIDPGQVEVQTGGVNNVLVSDLDGGIEAGDQIATSSLVGFGGKLKGNGWIVGTAQTAFNAHTSGAIKSTVDDATGNKHDVYVGSIPVLIKVTYYNPSATGNQPSKTIIPETLQATIDSVAGRRASQLAVLLAFFLLLAGVIVAGFIISSAIKNAMVATARQPLAKQAVFRRMFQSCALALGIVAVSLVSALIVVRIL